MSNNEKVTEESKTTEKLVTKYDRKMQKRKEEREREEREKRIASIVSIVVLVALVCLVVSFPIRSYLSLHSTFVTIGGENLTRVEFEYNYNIVKNNYINNYGDYLSYFGLDVTKDFSDQMYDESLTWKDYFEEMAVDSLIRNKALKAEAKKAGFVHDTKEEYTKFENNIKKAASDAGKSVNEYVKSLYGSLATLDRIAPYVKESMEVSAYYDKVTEDKLPSESEIQAYYEENKEDYDSVDYRSVEIYAELPTEPTELADPVEETDEEEDSAYEPSDAEIEKAMEDARAKADAAEQTVAADGALKENVKQSSASYLISDWLFDDSRKKGDTTVIEDNSSHKYYVLAFENRYLDNTPSVSARVAMTTEDGASIIEEWKAGAATEESFGALCDKYSVDTNAEGGLYKNLTNSGLPESLSAWLFAEERKAGDVESIFIDDAYYYVIYFVEKGRPQWQLDIEETLSDETMDAYIEEIRENCKVEDTHDNLPYIKKREEQSKEAENESEESEELGEETEDETE